MQLIAPIFASLIALAFVGAAHGKKLEPELSTVTSAGKGKSKSKSKSKSEAKSEAKAKEGAKKLVAQQGNEWPNEPRAYSKLPAKARAAIKGSFNATLQGRTVVVVEDGKKVEVTIQRFGLETGDGSELRCEFSEDAIGCWHASGNFTGCYAVNDGADWECIWNDAPGDSDD